jgi:protein-tyrosine phosphatase
MTSSMQRKPKFLEPRYGGKSAFLQHQATKIRLYTGKFRRWQNVDFEAVDRFIFICKGNISRSPYSEARSLQLGHPAISLGTEAEDGKPAESSACRNALARGLDLSAHGATSLASFAPGKNDLVLCYEPIHALFIEKVVTATVDSEQMPQVSLLGLWSSPCRPLIFDPYSLHDQYYQTCYTVIDSAIANLIALTGSPAVPETNEHG